MEKVHNNLKPHFSPETVALSAFHKLKLTWELSLKSFHAVPIFSSTIDLGPFRSLGLCLSVLSPDYHDACWFHERKDLFCFVFTLFFTNQSGTQQRRPRPQQNTPVVPQ